MFPQQQQSHVSFTNLQQPYYSPDPFLLSFPQPSVSVLHPPGTDPLGKSISYLSNPTPSPFPAYGAQTTDSSQNWIANQASPIGYDLVVGLSQETSAVSTSLPATCNDTCSHQIFANDTTVMIPNQSKVTNPIRCEVCKIDCNSRDVYEKHISGKKHKGNLQLQISLTNIISSRSSHASVQSQTSSIQGQVLTGAVGQESKKQKVLNGGATIDSVKVCTVCNIECNSQEVLIKHLAGRKHRAQVNSKLN